MNKIDLQTKKIDFYIKGIFLFIFCSILFLTVAYSATSTTATIEGIMASVKPIQDARITGIMTSSTTNNGISNAEDYNAEKIYGTIELGNSDSTVTYKISVTVFLASEMQITAITGLNSHLEYELTDYQLGNPLCNTNNECNYGATAEFYLTIRYKQGEYDGVNTSYPFDLEFTFAEMNYVARIGSTRYNSLQDAVSAVPTNNVETTVILLKNTTELVTINTNQNVNFDFQNNTITNNGNIPVIENYGTVKIHNGTITSNATQGAINNQSGGNMVISGGRVIATGTRQAVYNNGGTIEITGDAYLSATTNQRGAVQNLSSGNMLITGGTIVSTRYSAVVNTANLTIGVKDGTIDGTTPVFQGGINGINTTMNINFYDGIMKGKTAAINDEIYITDKETGYDLLHGKESIDGAGYKTIRLAEVVVITFDVNGGTVDEQTREHQKGTVIGTLPSPTRTDHEFQGWYTEAVGGRKIDETEVINNDVTFHAQWIHNSQIITAEIGGVTYNTLQQAIEAVPKNNTPTTVTLLRDTSEFISIVAGQNVVFNLQNYTIRNKGVSPVIKNRGTLTITNGTITSNTTQGAINNEIGGVLTMSGGQIIATGTRQAIYNDGGTLTITGNAYLTSSTAERATVQNLSNGTITITGGTIISTGLYGVENTSNLTVGIKDGSIQINSPIIQGVVYGIHNTSTLNFYDGTIKGKTDTIDGTIADQEQNTTRYNGTEVINGETYQVTYLQ